MNRTSLVKHRHWTGLWAELLAFRARVRRALAKTTKAGSSTHLSRYGKAFDKSIYSFTTHNRPGTGQWLNITRASVKTQVTQEERTSTSPPPSASQPHEKGRKAPTLENSTCYRLLTSYSEGFHIFSVLYRAGGT